ncbi:uncharacterized protein LOC103718455 [Phoenix dactylifera]|uniref:Uncharacterized protein LOC103718455 n=1 Tax=Phoenix dactylifera TaxID=42345 RepID=A0A8B7MWE5_PHODC|nr:uncharacterized protein LOC103718455 [Phoenix dactylifera]XP_008805511.2 uncharacterized protein LOC103718455 [Phoenix dactylifera]XP_017701043.2 uncharacterized protein LOC103718455 [Phoenix dactylifera]
MLSIENPSDPSCSSKLPALKTDERASEKLALQEADPGDLCERPTPNFSIRDYVFTSRSKGIGTNWPFPQELLQLCLKHGISDLLPPFEPPDLVRAQCLRKKVEPNQPVACSEADLPGTKDAGPSDVGAESIKSHSCSLLDDLVVELSEQTQYTSPDKGKSIVDQGVALDEHIHRDAEISLAVRSHNQAERISCQIGELPCSVSVNKSFSEASSELEVAGPAPLPQKVESSRESLEKKCRLIVKLGAISEANRAEDIASNTSTVSDPMASKICPVCKTFASTSNTTLNAHIDQCLSVESSTKRVLTNVSAPKVKTRKKRLMVDIYKSAPRCTLEDLDRRNGTNWASELACVALTNEYSTETKRPKLLSMDARGDGDGEVYVDSNGIKLRILSKLNDTPAVISREETKLRKHAKGIKTSKTILISKKKRFTSKCSKNMKVKAHNKKSSSFKLLKARVKPAPGGDSHADTSQDKEESNISTACDQVISSGSATLRQWVSSKRSDLPKKLNNKDSHKTLENPVAITKDTLTENDQPDSCNTSAVRSHILKFSRPSEDLITSPKTQKVNFLSNMAPAMEDGKKKSPEQPVSNVRWSSENNSSACGLLIRLSRSSATLVSSPRSKREEINMGSLQKSDNSSDMTIKRSENCQTLVKDQACSTLEKNVLVRTPSLSLESSKGNLNEKPSKKFRKNRSILRTGKREVRSLVKGLHDSIKDLSPDNTRANETPRTQQSGFLEGEHVSRPPIGKVMEQVSPSTIGISEPMREREAPTAMEDSPLEAECHEPRSETRDMQFKVSSSFAGDHVTDPYMEKATSDPVTSETAISENLMQISNTRLDPQLSVEECVLPLSSGDAHVPRVMQKSLCKQEIRCGVVLHDEDVSQENQIADVAGPWGLKDSCASQHTECQADTASIQESSACLTSHGDMGLEVHQENSSATSIRVTSNNLANDGEPAESPDSTASTVSLPSPKDSSNRDSEAELLLRDTPAQDKFSPAVPSTDNSGGTEGSIAERIDRESKVILPENKAEQSPKDQSFCCSCRESLSKESQFMRNSVTAGTTPPSKGNMISSLHIGPRMPSSFHLYQSPKTNAIATSCLESPTQSNSTKVSSDSAINFPACSDLGSPSPSPRSQMQSNTIPKLRLMGKDLMVVNKEEPVQPQTAASDYLTNTTCLSSLRFASTNLVVNHESFQYHHQLPGGSVLGRPPSTGSHQMPHYPPGFQAGGFAGAPMQHGLMDHHSQQKKSYKNPISPAACSLGRTVSSNQQHQKPPSSTRAPYFMREVIVIDDCPEPEADTRGSLVSPAGALPPAISGPDPMLQRQVTYFPSHNQFILRDVSGSPRPSFPNLYPSANPDFMKRAYLSEGSGPLLPNPFVFQSPTAGQLSPLYHSQTHR